MKIGLQTWGTEGDIRPFIALASGLQKAGHQVTVLTTEIRNREFSEEAERLKIDIRPVGRIECSQERFKQLAKRVFHERNPARQGLILMENFFDPAVGQMLDGAKHLCAENDAVIGHFFVWPLKIAAKQTGRPHMTVHTTPIIPSSLIPPQGLPNLGRFWNWFWWQVMDKVLNKMWKPQVDEVFRQEGIEPEKSLMKDIWHSSLLNLVSVSPSLFKPPGDWSDHVHLCGFFNLDSSTENEQIPGGLKTFLDSGETPIYMTFGSMLASDPDPGKITRLMIDAALKAGVRAIIQSNWDDMEKVAEHPSIYQIKSISHRLVFPRCNTIVHHGGAGTTQAAIEAGCPSVIVAHASDQPFWGEVLKRQGTAPKMLIRRSVTVDKLARAIRTVQKTPEMAATARKISRRMRTENGVQLAVERIESAMPKTQ